MQLIKINNVEVSFKVLEKEIFIASLDIARVFDKRHDNIIAQIRALPQDEFTVLNFKVSSYKDSTGRVLPCYNLTRDGFSLLVMGFTGEKAYKWKIEFIRAFNEMEKLIRDQNLTLDLISELRDSNSHKDCLKRENENLKDEVIALQRKLLSLYDRNISKEQEAKVVSKHYGQRLSNNEKAQIRALRSEGKSIRQIQHILQRSESAVLKVIKNDKRGVL